MTDNVITVDELFKAVLNRDPIQDERDYWGHQLSQETLETVIRRLAASPEHGDLINNRRLMFVPAGHFYSPIVDEQFVTERKSAIFDQNKQVHGIDFRDSEQCKFIDTIKVTDRILPFTDAPKAGLRYHYDNEAFVFGDAVVYASMILKHRPKTIVEVGCGYSSALALDVCELINDYEPTLHFYDPYPKLINGLTANYPLNNVVIHEKFIQDVNPEELAALQAGDFYFLDTTHIVKTGSDVLFHFEEVFPRLKSGVIIHIHDVFYPFEYPQPWVLEMHLSWNEIYYVRAFLTHNNDYEILYFNNYVHHRYIDLLSTASQTCARHPGAGLWLRKK